MVNYISQLIHRLALITAHLISLTGKAEFIWTPTHTQGMENVKRAAVHNQVLKPIYHESALEMWLITEASDIGVGVCVGQGETADTCRPAALVCKKFSNGR